MQSVEQDEESFVSKAEESQNQSVGVIDLEEGIDVVVHDLVSMSLAQRANYPISLDRMGCRRSFM